MKIYYKDVLDMLWETRQLFYRPDPLGFCVIMNDFDKMEKRFAMTVEERQKAKGYMK